MSVGFITIAQKKKANSKAFCSTQVKNTLLSWYLKLKSVQKNA